MIAKEMIRVELTKPFSLRERLRVLMGSQLKMIAVVEVTAVVNTRKKEVKITSEHKGTQAFYGVPEKTKVPVLALTQDARDAYDLKYPRA